MSKPKGGRGHAAPYTTKLVRIPTLLAKQVSVLTERYHDYLNAGGDPLNPPVLLEDKPVNTLEEELAHWKAKAEVGKQQSDNVYEQIETLKAEAQQLRSQLAALKQEKAKLQADCNGLVGLAEKWQAIAEQQQPDYELLRDRALAKLKLGRQAPEYKRTKKAMDLLLDELL